MAVFRFRMQNILEMKEKLEEQAKNEFAHAQRALAEEEELLNALFHIHPVLPKQTPPGLFFLQIL